MPVCERDKLDAKMLPSKTAYGACLRPKHLEDTVFISSAIRNSHPQPVNLHKGKSVTIRITAERALPGNLNLPIGHSGPGATAIGQSRLALLPSETRGLENTPPANNVVIESNKIEKLKQRRYL